MSAQTPHLLYCRCAYAQVVPQTTKDEVLQALCESEATFESVSDLCEMAAHRDPRLQAFASQPCLRIAACYPRVVRGLFQQAEAALANQEVMILNMRTENAQDIVDKMLSATNEVAA